MSTHVPGFQLSGSAPAANSRRILKLMLMGILVPEWLMVNPSNAKATFKIHLNPVILVFIGKLSRSTLR